ncbi:MAG TPA: DUF4157 domain-containing protein [Longimicrobium sp.]|jgi:hypothetical protein
MHRALERARARRGDPRAAERAGRAPSAPPRPGVALARALGNRDYGRLVQPKLAVGPVDDPLEREADRVADAVLGARPGAGTAGDAAAPPIRRRASPDAAASRAPFPVPAGFQSRLAGLGGGEPLSPGVRSFFEPRLGTELGGVRVHAGPAASAAAESIRARAFTLGSDVVFGAGEYAPGTRAGTRLLAHELAHVAQQGRAGGEPVVRRYEGPEHQDLGDRHLNELLAFLETDEGRAWAAGIGEDRDRLVAQIRADPLRGGGTIRLEPFTDRATGETSRAALTPGQVIALMGDFYGSVEELAGADPREIRQLLEVLERERAGTADHVTANAAYERITGGRYLRLAERNAVHFASRNRAQWRRLHAEALDQARAAGPNDALFERALLRDAAAGHFLTDAYASGHLLDYDRVLAAIELHLRAHPIQTANPEMQAYVGVVAISGRLKQLVLKNLHDRLNREGFEVTNARGMRWRTHGDDHLVEATETQRVAALAVFRSRQQLRAARAGEPADPAEVEALMPDDDSVRRATERAIDYIPGAAAEVEPLIYRSRALAPTQFGLIGGSIVQSNLSTIGDPARERRVWEMMEQAEQIGSGPVVAPSFTLGRW